MAALHDRRMRPGRSGTGLVASEDTVAVTGEGCAGFGLKRFFSKEVEHGR